MASPVFLPAEVKRLLEQGVQLVDVLGADEFAHDHLPGAINIPLKQLDRGSVRGLDRGLPVIVYCYDSQ